MTAENRGIRPIDKAAVHRICSGQVILDLATAVKELVENALDAGATSIEIRLKEYGAELLEVADNGCGVKEQDYEALMLKYHTSKLASFDDLADLSNFGFRGEALSSLCALGDVSVVTRTASDECGARLMYDHSGQWVSRTPAPRAVGTTIAVQSLFQRLPVRHREFQRGIKREYARLVSLLQAYALIATGVRIICTNQAGAGTRSIIVATQAMPTLRDNVLAIFGGKIAEALEPVDHKGSEGTLRITGLVSKATAGTGRGSSDSRQFFFVNGRPVDMPKATKVLNEAFRTLSSPAAAISRPMAILNFELPYDAYDINVTPDKRKVFLHDEPYALKTLYQALEQLWEPSRSRYAVNGSGVAGLELTAQPSQGARRNRRSSADDMLEDKPLNITALESTDGGAVGEPGLIAFIAGEVDSERDIIQISSPRNQQPQATTRQQAAHESAPLEPPEALENSQDLGVQQVQEDEMLPLPKRRAMAPRALDSFALGDGASAGHRARSNSISSRKRGSLMEYGFRKSARESLETAEPSAGKDGSGLVLVGAEEGVDPAQVDDLHLEKEEIRPEAAEEKILDGGVAVMTIENDDNGAMVEGALVGSEEDLAATVNDANQSQDLRLEKIDTEAVKEEDCAVLIARGVEMVVDIEAIRTAALRAAARSAENSTSLPDNIRFQNYEKASLASKVGEIGASGDEEANCAANELERIFDKADFAKMQVVGQFNLGFIVARLGKDLFIVDQHASDEKYNFEKLQTNLVLNRQPLLHPQPLGLSPAEALVIQSNLDVFRKNGFEFVTDNEGKLLLSAVPFSKGVTFGVDDVMELVELLDGSAADESLASSVWLGMNGSSTMVLRPSRVRAMLASRACRSSIMIGRALDRRTMQRILKNLSSLQSPWNCPHGRPTMRHLAVLNYGV